MVGIKAGEIEIQCLERAAGLGSQMANMDLPQWSFFFASLGGGYILIHILAVPVLWARVGWKPTFFLDGQVCWKLGLRTRSASLENGNLEGVFLWKLGRHQRERSPKFLKHDSILENTNCNGHAH